MRADYALSYKQSWPRARWRYPSICNYPLRENNFLESGVRRHYSEEKTTGAPMLLAGGARLFVSKLALARSPGRRHGTPWAFDAERLF